MRSLATRRQRVTALFTDDAVLELSAGRFEGIDAIRAFYAKRQASTNVVSRHVSTNISIDVVDADHATGLVRLTFYRVVWDGEGPRNAPVEHHPL